MVFLTTFFEKMKQWGNNSHRLPPPCICTNKRHVTVHIFTCDRQLVIRDLGQVQDQSITWSNQSTLSIFHLVQHISQRIWPPFPPNHYFSHSLKSFHNPHKITTLIMKEKLLDHFLSSIKYLFFSLMKNLKKLPISVLPFSLELTWVKLLPILL